jgi:hypothetical protein
VPKKRKLITCSRCHRTIPAEELSDHLSQHKGKKKSVLVKSTTVAKSTTVNRTKYPEFQPYGGAPTTPHILWTLKTDTGGMVGGAYDDAIYSSQGLSGALVVNGTLTGTGNYYYTVTKSITETIAGLGFYTGNEGTTCVDLETAKKLWFNSDIKSGTANSGLQVPTFTKSEETVVRAGGVPVVSYAAYIMQIVNGRLCKWQAYTGALVCNVTAMTGTYDCP